MFPQRHITRRALLLSPAVAAFASAGSRPLPIPLHRVTDGRAQCTPSQFRDFWTRIWPEACRDLARGGMSFQTSDGPGEVKRTAADRPVFVGLRRGILNLVLTDHIPMYWDRSRARAGVTTQYDGYHICMIALRYAHANQIPFVAVNTCLHEILHALLQDIFVTHPRWYQSAARENRIDWYATRLWLFHDGATVRQSAQAYLARLQSSVPPNP